MDDHIVRLRADPKLVRVSFRYCRGTDSWRVCIESSDRTLKLVEWFKDYELESSIDTLLQRAENMGIKGIDRGCDWAYDHPQFTRE